MTVAPGCLYASAAAPSRTNSKRKGLMRDVTPQSSYLSANLIVDQYESATRHRPTRNPDENDGKHFERRKGCEPKERGPSGYT